MVHEMNLQDSPFKKIDAGTKTIELRLFDEKRRKIKVGDIIEFNNNNLDYTIKTEVINLHVFPNFKDLYKNFNKVAIGYNEKDVPNSADMEQYYDELDIKKYGVVGIEIKKI